MRMAHCYAWRWTFAFHSHPWFTFNEFCHALQANINHPAARLLTFFAFLLLLALLLLLLPQPKDSEKVSPVQAKANSPAQSNGTAMPMYIHKTYGFEKAIKYALYRRERALFLGPLIWSPVASTSIKYIHSRCSIVSPFIVVYSLYAVVHMLHSHIQMPVDLQLSQPTRQERLEARNVINLLVQSVCFTSACSSYHFFTWLQCNWIASKEGKSNQYVCHLYFTHLAVSKRVHSLLTRTHTHIQEDDVQLTRPLSHNPIS